MRYGMRLAEAMCIELKTEEGIGGMFLHAANKSIGLLNAYSGYRTCTCIYNPENGALVQVLQGNPTDTIDYIGRMAIGVISLLFIAPFLLGLAYKFVHVIDNRALYQEIIDGRSQSYHLSFENLATVPPDVLSDEETQNLIGAIPSSREFIRALNILFPFQLDQAMVRMQDIGAYSRPELIRRLESAIDIAENEDRNANIPFINNGRAEFRDELRQHLKLIIALFQRPETTDATKIAVMGSLYSALTACQPTWIRVTRAVVDQYYHGTDAKGKWRRAIQNLKNHTVQRFARLVLNREFNRRERDAVHHHLDNEILRKLEHHIYPDMSAARRDHFNSQSARVSAWFTIDRCLNEFYQLYTPDEIGETLETEAYLQFNEDSEEERELLNESMKKAVLEGDMTLFWVPPNGWTPPENRRQDFDDDESFAQVREDFEASYDQARRVFRGGRYFSMMNDPQILFRDRAIVIRGCAQGERPEGRAIPIRLSKPVRDEFENEQAYQEALSTFAEELGFFVGNCISSSYNFTVGAGNGVPNEATPGYSRGGRCKVTGFGKQLAATIGVLSPPLRA